MNEYKVAVHWKDKSLPALEVTTTMNPSSPHNGCIIILASDATFYQIAFDQVRYIAYTPGVLVPVPVEAVEVAN